MAKELENALKQIAAKVGQYVDDAARMQVETKYVQVTAGAAPESFGQASPAAITIIQLDGDSEVVVPMRQGASGQLEVDESLFETHERNVKTAIEYRTGILSALLSALQAAR